ncbi:hypothetical protein B0I35DRAFT_462048 [Stachybotrys elegans]|uniref:Glucose-methanol-choline oxidoreductase N-terminal domain-containing protein n=1 Tax=Stachybotrys elegans TaxID=80388 RepID=A0A8K0SPW4_9HYPO|nr:hypothetical protein B0I35DRAFT_462048 [Stachybotrys elegans]
MTLQFWTVLLAALATVQAAYPRELTTYDYVIVGGGTAGLTLAARLSEDDDVTVAVVEAGAYYQMTNPVLSSTPAGAPIWSGSSPADVNPGVDWGFVTAPQAGANGREIHYARGKCLGGSSARNFMVYHRPDVGSLQQWADMVDDQSYTFDNMLPFFKKSVTFTPPGATRFGNATVQYSADAFGQEGGPLQVSYSPYANPFTTWMPSAFAELGIKETQDFNSGNLLGSQYCSSTIHPRNAFRSDSQSAFLESAQARPNLRVYYYSLAMRIIFDKKRAVGIELESGVKLYSRREVILSAGAFQSPQLLMVSGIGPADALKKLAIPVIADRPGVGQNMSDHVIFGPSYNVDVPTLGPLLTDPAVIIAEIMNYFALAQGPLTSPATEFLGFEKVPRDLLSNSTAEELEKFPESWPELEYVGVPIYVGNMSSAMEGPIGGNIASIIASLAAPLSRGSLTISSANMADAPVIDPNWMTHKVDQELAVLAYKRIRQVFASDALRPIISDPVEYFPGPQIQTDEEILEVLRETVMTVWHASTTCRMGRRDDPSAVVDSQARVIGVEGLRVVDASSFALLPPGHPQGMIYGFAEKIANDIRGAGDQEKGKVPPWLDL